MVRKAIKHAVYLGIVVSVVVVYLNRDSIISCISSCMEKCVFCYFENRHHCNICRMSHKQCLFCDKLPIDNPKANR